MGLHPQSVTEQLLLFGDLCGSSEEMIALAAANNFKQLVREKLSESHGSTEVEVTLETIVIPLFVKLANHDKAKQTYILKRKFYLGQLTDISFSLSVGVGTTGSVEKLGSHDGASYDIGL